MFVRELMTHSVEWTAPTATLANAARRMRDGNIGCLPVGAADSFIGMLTEKDLTARATAEGLNPTTTTVLQIMTHGVTYCQDDDTIEDALSTMRQTAHSSPSGSQPVEPGDWHDFVVRPRAERSAAALSGHRQRDLQERGIASDSRKSSNELT